MRSRRTRRSLTGMFMAMMATISGGAMLSTEERELKKGNSKSYSPSKQGMKWFVFEDGFKCEALNQKNANKKHERWKRDLVNNKD